MRSSASTTVRSVSSSSRVAKRAVKPAGMCCAMTIGGQSGGICPRTMRIASTPPVDAPMAISEPAGAAAVRSGTGGGAAARIARPRTSELAAARTLWRRLSPKLSRPPASEALGLATKSTAPSSIASSVSLAPLVVRVETITTGSGWSRISLSRNCSPFMFGISMSSVTTSGESSLILARASIGSSAVPTTVMSPSRPRVRVSTSRMSAESSTTSTLIMLRPSPCAAILPGRWSCRRGGTGRHRRRGSPSARYRGSPRAPAPHRAG